MTRLASPQDVSALPPFGRAARTALALVVLATTRTAAQATAATPDPRVGLRAGWMDAAQAAWNLRLVSTSAPAAEFTNPAEPGDFNYMNSDLAFQADAG